MSIALAHALKHHGWMPIAMGIGVAGALRGGSMSGSAVLKKPALGLEDLDAFVDESIDAMDEKEFEAYKAAVGRIERHSKQRVSVAGASALEKVQSV